jgi:cysteine desulfuration protein SufE
MTIVDTDQSSPSFSSCLMRQGRLVQEFSSLAHQEARYERLIEMGRHLPLSQDPELCTPQHLVYGCQSEVYLRAREVDGKIFFSIHSEALISRGLAALLLAIYDGEYAETIVKCPPHCLAEMGILASLTPGRSGGLTSMHLRMQQEAIQYLINF